MRDWRIHVLPACDALKPLPVDPGVPLELKPPTKLPAAEAPNPATPALPGDVPNETAPSADACRCAAWPPAVVSGDAPAWRASARWTAWKTN